MTAPQPSVRRVLAGAGHGPARGARRASPTGPDDVAAITALMRAVDIAGCGHTSTNIEEVSDDLADPECGWEYGSAMVWRGTDLVGAALVFDGLVDGRGWMIDVYARPGDPRARVILGALIDAALREGRYRWDALYMDPEVPLPTAKAGCYVNDGALRAELEQRGFAEVRRFWRMKVDHWSVEGLSRVRAPRTLRRIPPASARCRAGTVLRPFRDDESGLAGRARSQLDRVPRPLRLHAARVRRVARAHARRDRGPDPVDRRRERRGDRRLRHGIQQLRQRGLRLRGQHRRRSGSTGATGLPAPCCWPGWPTTSTRGFLSTILHVDATSPTGATRLYESVGMVADSEFVGFHRPLFR